jgi:hypothetical protein
MTREKLQSLSDATLETVAKREGIRDHEASSRSELIDLILEAMEEDRNERQYNNNAAMRLECRKYDILKDEEVEALIKEEYPLPEGYNTSRVVLLLRDPSWAFAYWDFNQSEFQNLRNEAGYQGFFLRVHEFSGETVEKDSLVEYFDIPIGESDTSRYINLPRGGSSYVLDLCCTALHKEHVIARSNSIFSPLGYFARHQEELFEDPNVKRLMLTGLWNYEQDANEERIPQRIFSILESHEIDL